MTQLHALGKSIRACRLRRNLTIQELSGRAGVSAPFISMVENGKRNATILTIWAISNAIGINLSALFQDAEVFLD